jgi:RNA polymerase sporulation-specific sigma factor
VKAIDNFDLSHGVKLSTYAVPMILGEVKRYLRDNGSLRVSRSLKDLAYNVLKTKEEMTKQLGREVSIEEISKELDIPTYDAVTALEAMRNPVSIFEPIYSDGGDTIYLYDQIEDKRLRKQDLDVNLAITNAIDNLEQREKYIIDQRYIIGKTQMELAEELGISQAQISRLEKNAITTLKKVLK